MRLDPFYPVVGSAAWVRRLVGAGARLVQLRIKDAPDLVVQLREAREACAAAGAALVLNDHWQLAIDEGLDWLHLGQEDLDGADLGAIRRAGLRLGVAPDYIALGPVWPTTLKKMPWTPQGVARLAAWKQRIGDIPLVAIGGITLERVPDCLAHGADSVAVVSDVTAHPDPEARARAWIAATRS